MANTVKATLTYFVPPADGSRPYQYMNADPVTGEHERNFTREPFEVEVENVRGKEDSVTLDAAGFQFFKIPAKHISFTSNAEIEAEYYPESIELIKRLTGASRVVLFDHSEINPFCLFDIKLIILFAY